MSKITKFEQSNGQFHKHFKRSFFLQKCFAQLFFKYSFGFVIFLRKKVGAKAAHKTMAKLTPIVNFINVIRAHFSYKFFNKAKT